MMGATERFAPQFKQIAGKTFAEAACSRAAYVLRSSLLVQQPERHADQTDAGAGHQTDCAAP